MSNLDNEDSQFIKKLKEPKIRYVVIDHVREGDPAQVCWHIHYTDGTMRVEMSMDDIIPDGIEDHITNHHRSCLAHYGPKTHDTSPCFNEYDLKLRKGCAGYLSRCCSCFFG